MLQKLMASEHYVTEINGFVQACLLQKSMASEHLNLSRSVFSKFIFIIFYLQMFLTSDTSWVLF